MDDNSCVVEYIEIVPVDNYENSSESSDVNLSPIHVKVCVYFLPFCAQLHDLTATLILFIFSVIINADSC